MKYIHIIILVLAAIIAITVLNAPRPVAQFGSTTQGNDYVSTTTRYLDGSSVANLSVLKTGSGALARITITGANTGIIRFWNATTSDVTKRTNQTASTSLLLAEIPTNASANDYDLDIQFNYGLLYEVIGTAPTSTIAWR